MIVNLDENAVRGLLQMEELIPAIASALADLSSKKAVQPVRVVLPVADHSGFFGVMPAYNGALGAKVVTFYPQNKDVHTHHGVILLFRPETGEPIAVMDGRLITEMRTAAASAVATDLLARRDTNVLAIIGSGVQAAAAPAGRTGQGLTGRMRTVPPAVKGSRSVGVKPQRRSRLVMRRSSFPARLDFLHQLSHRTWAVSASSAARQTPGP